MNKAIKRKRGKNYGGVDGHSMSESSGVAAWAISTAASSGVLTTDHDSKKIYGQAKTRLTVSRRATLGPPYPCLYAWWEGYPCTENNESDETTKKEWFSLNRATCSSFVSVQCLFSLYFYTPRKHKWWYQKKKWQTYSGRVISCLYAFALQSNISHITGRPGPHSSIIPCIIHPPNPAIRM